MKDRNFSNLQRRLRVPPSWRRLGLRILQSCGAVGLAAMLASCGAPRASGFEDANLLSTPSSAGGSEMKAAATISAKDEKLAAQAKALVCGEDCAKTRRPDADVALLAFGAGANSATREEVVTLARADSARMSPEEIANRLKLLSASAMPQKLAAVQAPLPNRGAVDPRTGGGPSDEAASSTMSREETMRRLAQLAAMVKTRDSVASKSDRPEGKAASDPEGVNKNLDAEERIAASSPTPVRPASRASRLDQLIRRGLLPRSKPIQGSKIASSEIEPNEARSNLALIAESKDANASTPDRRGPR